ncbi:MAG: FHA domain-containing protein [Deltaproteobacteria bacterium]|nr:FHA domain-containing protein [Deltaproteobacteria bacterium]
MAGHPKAYQGASILQVSLFYQGGYYGTECFSQKHIIIGRVPNADINVQCDLVSRRHAEIQVIGDKIFVQDLSSRNGIRVNGRPVAKALMGNWDELSVGDYKMKFHLLNYGSPRPTSQFEVLSLDSDPGWSNTSELNSLGQSSDDLTCPDDFIPLAPPIPGQIELEDDYLVQEHSADNVFALADLLEPDPCDTMEDFVRERMKTEIDHVRKSERVKFAKIELRKALPSRPKTRISQAPSKRYSSLLNPRYDESYTILLVG